MESSKFEDLTGDILSAPNNAVILHATNCLGEWGSGIALALKKALPHAFKRYREYCDSATTPESLAGRCLLIPPQVEDDESNDKKMLWVGCLFTSVGYGRKTKSTPGRSSQADILAFTNKALEGFREQLKGRAKDARPAEVWMCQFNSGSFKVPWKKSEAIARQVLDEWAVGNDVRVVIVRRPVVQKQGRKRKR